MGSDIVPGDYDRVSQYILVGKLVVWNKYREVSNEPKHENGQLRHTHTHTRTHIHSHICTYTHTYTPNTHIGRRGGKGKKRGGSL